MQVLIIEDERPASQKLQRMLNELDESIDIAGPLESVEDAINWFLANQAPDLVFMDIQLDDGICFEIFENISIETPVIFTTAYDNYALKAFKVNSVDYLLKPIDRQELEKAIDKFKMIHAGNIDFSKIEKILKRISPERKERLLIKTGMHYRSIQITDINCFFTREKSVFINKGGTNDYAVDFSLDKAEKMTDPKRFFRVNRNYIINFTAIRDIIAYSSSRLKIIIDGCHGDNDIIVSRERVADFKKWMDR
ncbi:MAG: LytTR family DNA-binding domain-containing protein [Bacteroidales bacterium]|nr:LytTR family DNA-binding domain-containing protein [Bacteroidales bacterium]